MLVSGSSEVQNFSDAVAAWYVDDGITGKRFQAEDLRELLVKRGLLAGSELYGRLHKALANDPRFAWSADNVTVTINLVNRNERQKILWRKRGMKSRRVRL